MQPAVAFAKRLRRHGSAVDPCAQQGMQVFSKNPHIAHDTARHGNALGLLPAEEMRAQAPLQVLLGRRQIVHREGGEPIVNRVDEVETRAAAVETDTFNGEPG